jgi:hypothetical protein
MTKCLDHAQLPVPSFASGMPVMDFCLFLPTFGANADAQQIYYQVSWALYSMFRTYEVGMSEFFVTRGKILRGALRSRTSSEHT